MIGRGQRLDGRGDATPGAIDRDDGPPYLGAVSRHRIYRWFCIAAVLGCLSALASQARAASATSPDVPALISKAKKLKLADKVTWLRLGHYRSGLFGGYASEADGAGFFLDPEGVDDPEAELEATLRALFAKPFGGHDKHALCRFPARAMWLASQLNFDASQLPKLHCQGYDRFLQLLRPEGLTLVFSAYFLNSPASAFGHTFLRVKRGGFASSGIRHDLLDYGVDYSATVDTGNAFVYALKGLTGQFNGEFRRLPYYYKAREYNDYESRDMWEYDLTLSRDEVVFVASHLWELGSTYFDYFYLSENCSYHILALLEVARPELDLLSKVSWPVIPADTIKALHENPGLIGDIHYRPSNRSQVRRRLAGLSGDEISLVSSLMSNPRTGFPRDMTEQQWVRSMDAAIDLLDVRLADDLGSDRSKLSKDMLNQQVLLERRSELPIEAEEHKFEPPFRDMPHIGHDSARLGLGTGYDHRREGYYALSLRLALHDLADPIPGYAETSTIEFLPMRLRYFLKDHAFQLQDISLVRVSSLAPVDRFSWPLAFKLDVGAFRTYDTSCRSCLAPGAVVGGGSAFSPFGELLLFYATGDVSLALPVDGGLLDVIRLGVGPSAGLRLRMSDRSAAVITGSWSYLPGQSPQHYGNLTGRLRFGISRNVALGVEGELHPKAQSVEALSYFYF